MWYKERMAPEGIKVFNPAFDVTDHELIAGIVTEYGVARAPYTESLAAIFAEKEKRAREKKKPDREDVSDLRRKEYAREQ